LIRRERAHAADETAERKGDGARQQPGDDERETGGDEPGNDQ